MAVQINYSALVTVEGRYDNQQIVNVFCYNRFGAPPSNADIDLLALWWGNTGWPAMKQVMSTSYSLYIIKVKSVHVVGGWEHDISPSGTQIGVRGGDPLPGQNSLAVGWRTGVNGRHGRGRNYMGPLSETDVTTNYVNTAYMQVMAAWAVFMISNQPGGIWDFAVGSRALHISNPVQVAAFDRTVDSTDRRKPGHGI